MSSASPFIDAIDAAPAAPEAIAPEPATSGCAYSPDVYAHLRGALGSPRREEPIAAAFSLGQNYPNPFEGETTVPFTLPCTADVRLEIFDAQGRKVAGVTRPGRHAGTQSIKLNLQGLGLPVGDYVYQLRAAHKHGVLTECKLMTAL